MNPYDAPQSDWEEDLRQLKARLTRVALFMIAVIGVGTAVYRIIDPVAGWVNAFYMTIITLTTVGYGEIIDLSSSPSGRLFTSFLILVGMGGVFYFLTTATAFIIEGQLSAKTRTLEQIPELQAGCLFTPRIPESIRARCETGIATMKAAFEQLRAEELRTLQASQVVKLQVGPEELRKKVPFFGETALLHHTARTATCRAVTPCALYELRRDDLDEVRARCPAIQVALAAADARRQAELREVAEGL